MTELNDPLGSRELPPSVVLGRLISGSAVTHMVAAVAELGVADLLQDGPKSSDELAEALEVHPRALYRLLRGLTTLGVFAEAEPGTFALTPAAELLRSDVDGSLRSWAILEGAEWSAAVWSNVLYSVRTHKSAFEATHGMGFFEFCANHPAAAKSFHDAMSSFSTQEAAAVLGSYDFSGIERLLDVGGGHGVLLAAILAAHPGMRGVLFDQPAVIAGAAAKLDEGVSERCELVAGDFFEAVPKGADAYIMKSILHDWNDELAIKILRNVRAAIPESGKLLIVERDLPEGSEPSPGKIFDVTMLVLGDGAERTEAEYRSLLEAGGFELKHVHRTPALMNVIEAVPSSVADGGAR